MTPDEFQTELIKRLRARYGFFERDCTDEQLLEFAKTTFGYRVVKFELRCHVFKAWFLRRIGASRSFEAEYHEYRLNYQTAMSKIRLMERRNAALRGHLKTIRRESAAKRRKDRSEG